MNDLPSKDSGDVRPSSLNHLIGQSHNLEVVSATLDYCFQEGVSFPHTLMLGPPGLGKTALARVIAQECASTNHELFEKVPVA